MTTVFCIHPHGFNIGNHAIHVALRNMLDQTFGEVVNVISIPATTRFESQGRAGLTPSVIHEINQYGDGVIVGGGNLFENAQLDIHENALKALEPPMMLFSLSRGRVYNRRGELVDRTDVMSDGPLLALHKAAMLSVARDIATYDHLTQIGCERVVLGGCPTLTLADARHQLPEVSDRDKGGVLLSIRNPNLMNIPLEAQAGVRQQVLGIVNAIQERTGVTPRLLCHDHRDIPFAATFPELEYVYTGDVYRFLALLAHARLCVSFRLHATIPCMAFGTPFVNITYDERAQSTLDVIGLGGWDIPLMAGGVLEQVQDRMDRLEELPQIVQSSSDVRRELIQIMRGSFAEFHRAVTNYRSPSTVSVRDVAVRSSAECSTQTPASM